MLKQMKEMKERQRKGFTLIELVMVIVILAILAVVAIPRFFDLSGEADIAAGEGVIGGVRAGIATLHAENITKNIVPAYPASLDSAVFVASIGCDATACFDNILGQGGISSADWTRTLVEHEFTFTPTGTTYTYVPLTGSFN